MKKLILSLGLIIGLAVPAFAEQQILKGSTAYPLGPILIVSSSDSKTGVTGCTPSTKKISKGFGSSVTPSGTWTELDSTNHPGVYYITGNATDTNTDGPIVAHIVCSSADPFDGLVGTVVDYDPRAATTLQNIVDAILNELCSAHTTGGSVCKIIADVKAKTDSLTFTTTNQVDATTMSTAANAITATSIASNAITSAKIATDAIGAAQIAADAIGASEIAANAIGASELASDAVAEIQSGLATLTFHKNTSRSHFYITFLDSSNNPVTGLATSDITCSVSKDGSSFSSLTDTTEVEIANGVYDVSLTAGETNADNLYFYCTGTGARAFRASVTTNQ